MPKYKLTIVENNTYEVIVEAENEQHAEDLYGSDEVTKLLDHTTQINGENYVESVEVQNA